MQQLLWEQKTKGAFSSLICQLLPQYLWQEVLSILELTECIFNWDLIVLFWGHGMWTYNWSVMLLPRSTEKEGTDNVCRSVYVAELHSALPVEILELTSTKPMYLCGTVLCNAEKLRYGKIYSYIELLCAWDISNWDLGP